MDDERRRSILRDVTRRIEEVYGSKSIGQEIPDNKGKKLAHEVDGMENIITDAIIADAYRAYHAGTAGPSELLIILTDSYHRTMPELIARAVVALLPPPNGNGNGHGQERRLRDKVREKTPAVLTRGGIATLVLERIFQVLT